MSAVDLFRWLMALAPCLDGYTHGLPIARRVPNAQAIARQSVTTEDPKRWAALLDVWGAYESGNADASAAGGCPGVPIGTLCKREHGARYCSPWMISCERVPVGSTLDDEARIAIAVFRESAAACPSHPFGFYAGVGCHAWRVVDLRVDLIRRELSVPLQENAE